MWAWGSVVFASDTQITVYIGPPDACKNIPGYQQDIPEGMQVENGDCFTPTPPPVDPCGTTTCEPVAAPIDTCENIDGAQDKIPAGMKRDSDGTCFTPAQLTQPELPNTTPTKEPAKPEIFGIPTPGHLDTSVLTNSPLSFLTPQVIAVVLTATVAVGSLVLVRYHHHRIGGFSSHHHRA